MAYEKSSMTPKSFHDTRHSFCTFFVEEHRNFFLARAILGYKSNAFERYLHIYEEMSLKAMANIQEIEEDQN